MVGVAGGQTVISAFASDANDIIVIGTGEIAFDISATAVLAGSDTLFTYTFTAAFV